MEISNSIIWYVVFLFSTTFHEAAHAWSAYKMGDKTAFKAGQVSLNPIPHIKREPVGTVIVPIISFLLGGWMIGWASTPYDLEWAYSNPKKAAAMAVAGPISNFLLLFISGLLIHVGIWLGYFYPPDSINISRIVSSYNTGIFEYLSQILSIMFSLNLILFVFNLIPVPPLDGSGIIPLYLNEESGRKYMDFISNSVFSMVGLFIAWKVFDLIFWKLHLVFINILYPGSFYE
ncbi:MAG: peptidase M50 [Stygiobacter sp.]|nr:MAG: peptidase M50 [Stygiobacter sp.]KAF0213228.1 MAG: peptidase [Ignavibacteria bacterium]